VSVLLCFIKDIYFHDKKDGENVKKRDLKNVNEKEENRRKEKVTRAY
jgi:hypothetical protein